MNTDIDVVNFNRIEYMEFLNKVIDRVMTKHKNRAVEIEAWKNNDFIHSLAITTCKFNVYEAALWQYTLNDNPLRWDELIDGDYITAYGFLAIEDKTIVEEIATETVIKTAIEQTWWEILCGKEIQYIETPHTKITKTEVKKSETQEEYWERLDAHLKTPEFERKYDLLEFYSMGLNNRSYYYNDTSAYNEFTYDLEILASDLKSVQSAPEANYTIDGKKFKKYTAYLSE